ncbi:MAG TPA: hypothetical protein PK447_02065 [Ignavibacteria bacterium]|nr:hypothetical protein [Ignavibacteria bacterium]
MRIYLISILIILTVVFFSVFDSCNFSDDNPYSTDFGYISIINNTPYNYYISIDSTHNDYCDYIHRWGKIFCDVPKGHHMVGLDGSDSCYWIIDVNPGETVYLSCGGAK